jgi:hypothetical protein
MPVFINLSKAIEDISGTVCLNAYGAFVLYPLRYVVWCTRDIASWFREWVKGGKVRVSLPTGGGIEIQNTWSIGLSLPAGGEAYIEYAFPSPAKLITLIITLENVGTWDRHYVRVYKDSSNYFELYMYNTGTADYIEVAKVVAGSRTVIKTVSFSRGYGYWIPLVLHLSGKPRYGTTYYHLDGYENYFPNAPTIWQLAPKHLGFGAVDDALDVYNYIRIGAINTDTATHYFDLLQIAPLSPIPFYLAYDTEQPYV